MVTKDEIIEALENNFGKNGYTINGNALAERIKAEGIAPPDGLELIADIEGIGSCTVIIRNGRVHIAAETVRDLISMGIGKIKAEGTASPDGVNWKELYRIQTAMRYMDANPSMTKESAFLMADTDIRCALLANTPNPWDV